MTLIDDRFAVGCALGELEPGDAVQAWIDRQDEAVDADGDQVICTFGASELAATMIRELAAFPHPVIAATIIDGRITVCVARERPELGPAVALVVDSLVTVGEVFTAIVRSEPGTETVLEHAGDRRLFVV